MRFFILYHFFSIFLKADGLDADNIPELRVYLKGEKKKPKIYREEIDLKKMWKFIADHISKKIEFEIEPFSQQEIENIAIELMDENDRIVLKFYILSS